MDREGEFEKSMNGKGIAVYECHIMNKAFNTLKPIHRQPEKSPIVNLRHEKRKGEI